MDRIVLWSLRPKRMRPLHWKARNEMNGEIDDKKQERKVFVNMTKIESWVKKTMSMSDACCESPSLRESQ